jgi:tRNA pseudouridine38-40 synthase
VRFAGLVEYDGTEFAGWAGQPDLRTVEGTLTEALETVLRQPVKLTVAGRTDAGAHASGQVVSFEAQTEFAPSSISYRTTAVLPEDLALRRCVSVGENFDARRDVKSRSYEYRVINETIRSPLERLRAIHVARRLDISFLQEVASLVRGMHDFRAFTPTKSYHIRFERVIKESLWEVLDGLLVYRITADSFLYGMVRTLVGTMLEVADGKRSLSEFTRLLSGDERSAAGPAASARGLTLVYVDYENLNLEGETL